MWYTLRFSSRADPQSGSAVRDLLESSSRGLMIVTGAAYVVWQVLLAAGYPGDRIWILGLIPVTVAAGCALGLWLLRTRFALAQLAWLSGLVAGTALAIRLFGDPYIGFIYALIPLLAAVTLGWQAALAGEIGVIGLVGWILSSSLLPPLRVPHALGIVLGGVLAGVTGWLAVRALLTVTHWSLVGWDEVQAQMQDAREQRLELEQVREDLVQANQELTRLSDRLRALHQVAEEARRAKEQFVANVSHELRTPLNMIIGFSEMIVQSPKVYGGKLPPALLADIAAIQRNSEQLARLVNDVLDLSQVDADRMALSKDWVELPEVLGEAALAVRPLYEAKGLDLSVEVAPDLPPIWCDGTRIRQVVLNLLSNAGRFTVRGGVNVAVWQEEERVVTSVTDTGPGIPPAEQARVFEPFQQLDASTRRRHGGSGLGLSISQRFIELHGGKMWVESPADKAGADGEGPGATFYFSLPLQTPVPLAQSDADAAGRWFSPYQEFEYRLRTRPSKAPAPTPVPRYVVLEQGETLQRLLSRYSDRADVISVGSPAAARHELGLSPARALLVNTPAFEQDLPLPEELADVPYDTPIVTCWVPGGEHAAQQLGVVRYLVKPVTSDTLLSSLESLGDTVETVLLVDDDPEVLQLFARMMSSTDRRYRVLRAKSGERALDMLRARRPDALLLDLIMPGKDGFEVLREKSADPSIRDIPVIIVSSRDPAGEPIAARTLTVTRHSGLSLRDLTTCIDAVSKILSPVGQLADQVRPETPAGLPASE